MCKTPLCLNGVSCDDIGDVFRVGLSYPNVYVLTDNNVGRALMYAKYE